MKPTPGTDDLVARARSGDEQAANQLLVRHRVKLRKMIGARLSRKIAARIDPSDVVQETLLIAHRRLPEYLEEAAVPFAVWIRQLAHEQLLLVYRQHVGVAKRSLRREVGPELSLSDDSVTMLVDRLFARDPGPHARVVKAELRARVQAALAELSETDRELLILRYIEQLPNAEIMQILGLGESALKMRHLRALVRLREKVDDASSDSS
ncbi:MAG TPA: sigma-70 family RNA polymerase sigma factor [Planctomycetaceae bacterium]|jgi:RNA polymerase sigma-70 factor (ECF subfamily)